MKIYHDRMFVANVTAGARLRSDPLHNLRERCINGIIPVAVQDTHAGVIAGSLSDAIDRLWVSDLRSCPPTSRAGRATDQDPFQWSPMHVAFVAEATTDSRKPGPCHPFHHTLARCSKRSSAKDRV